MFIFMLINISNLQTLEGTFSEYYVYVFIYQCQNWGTLLPTSHGMLPAALPYLRRDRGINPYFNYSYLHTATATLGFWHQTFYRDKREETKSIILKYSCMSRNLVCNFSLIFVTRCKVRSHTYYHHSWSVIIAVTSIVDNK